MALNYSWLIAAFPAAAFVIISILTIRRRNISAFLSILGIFLSFIISLGVLLARLSNPQAPPFEMGFDWIVIRNFNIQLGILIDNLTAMMLIVVSLVAFLIQVYSAGYMGEEKDASFARYYAYMSLFAASMLTLVLCNNFVQIYITWELVGLCSYLLIGFWYQKKSAADAAKKAFIVTRFGDLGFLIGIIIISTQAGTFNFLQIGNLIPQWAQDPSIGIGFITICAILIFCGAVGKSAQFPLHIWLPDAMEGPTPVSALIHAATMVAAGVYLVARVFVIFHASPAALLVVAYIGAITALIAASIAIVQNDIKRVLAYSTISQLGYMMLALGVGGYTAGTFHLMTHAFFKALLFLCAGSAIHALHTNDMWEMGGLGKKMRITGLTCLAGCLAIAGIPPFSGFWSKDEILTVVWNFPGHGILKVVAFAVVFMTAFYMFRMYYLAFCGEFRGKHEPHESPAVMTIPLIILAFFAIFVGFVGTPCANYFGDFISFAPSETEAATAGVHINYAAMGLSLILAIMGILLAYTIYRAKAISEEALQKRYRTIYLILEKKYWMDEFYCWMVRNVLFLMGKISAFIDRYIIDGIVNVVGWATKLAGIGLRYEQTGLVQYYALVIVLGAIMLMLGLGLLDQSFILNIMRPFQVFLDWLHGGI